MNNLKQSMKTQNEFTQHSNLNNASLTTEVMNDESINAKIRQVIEEWDEQKGSGLNRFRSPGTKACLRNLEK
jgi:hypothetical protein